MIKGTETRAPLWKRHAFSVGMLVVGGLVGFTGSRFVSPLMSGRPWSDHLSMLIAVALGVLGVIILAGRWIGPLGRAMTQSDSNRLDPLMKRLLSLQGITLILAGLAMGAVPLLSAAAIDRSLATLVYAGVVAVLAVQTGVNVLIWRRGDEFHRRAMLETGALSFWILQGALFLWAAAERLNLVPALTSWDLMAVTMAVYLVLSSFVAWRLGNT
ncbi:putative membrane protein [Asticcacaulis biprosthecium C19]|uniref:Putative membrane protein n=1 Tax=Asticcacaulis biprosthecium C19 TaxID=715226 RepID=F4QL80_9CAUL|nr:hypothetical protein [Asticcacaulis biprosthecium]EGF93455.1 putative membrane protein [Asticcacaulis biprosthecium C19]